MDEQARPLQPVDVVVALKFAALRGGDASVRALAEALDVPKSTVDVALGRLAANGLLRTEEEGPRLNRLALRELVRHGVRWIAPAAVGRIELGLATGVSAPVLRGLLVGDDEGFVMPLPEGPARGRAVSPVHPCAPGAARRDGRLYELLALTDVFRIGGAREREVALPALYARL